MGKHFWEQTIPAETEIEEITYSCPDCGEVLLSVPFGQSVPQDKITVTCSKGHKVKIPNFQKQE